MLNAQLDRDVTILLVDDDDVDAMSIQRTLKKQNLPTPDARPRWRGRFGIVAAAD